jgi:hypothetical protein
VTKRRSDILTQVHRRWVVYTVLVIRSHAPTTQIKPFLATEILQPHSSNLENFNNDHMLSGCFGYHLPSLPHDSSRRNLGFQVSFRRDGRLDLLTVPENSLVSFFKWEAPSPSKERRGEGFRTQYLKLRDRSQEMQVYHGSFDVPTPVSAGEVNAPHPHL